MWSPEVSGWVRERTGCAPALSLRRTHQRGHSHLRVSLGCLECRRHTLSRWLSVGLQVNHARLLLGMC